MSIISIQAKALGTPNLPLLPFSPITMPIKKILTSFQPSQSAPPKILNTHPLPLPPLLSPPNPSPTKPHNKKNKGN